MHLVRGRVNIWEQMVPGVYSWGNGDLQGAESLRAEDEGAARGHSRAEESPGSLWRVLGLSWGKQEKDLGQGRDSLKPQGWAPFVVICGYLGCFHSWFLFFPSPLKNVTNSMRFLTSPALKNHFSHIPVSFTLHGQNPTCSHQNGLKSGDFQDQGTSIRNFSHLQQIQVFLHQANPPQRDPPGQELQILSGHAQPGVILIWIWHWMERDWNCGDQSPGCMAAGAGLLLQTCNGICEPLTPRISSKCHQGLFVL